MNDDIDDLDRAIFALPLDAPPSGLRDAILRATIYAESVSPLAFARWEIAGIGAALALGAWLVLMAVANHAFAASFSDDVYAFVRGIGEPTTLAWMATGVAIVMIAIFGSFTLPRLPVRNVRS
ncbi:MAG: hypothetical protein IAI50_07225 [Candidatus Eremiobacteraeota bacterium]|nr:hypothetical protein [Candidatus Eremiobacteraeota bacterium]